MCVSEFERGWGYQSEVKRKRKEEFFFLLRCQIIGEKAMVATKSSFEFMNQRDQTSRFFSANKF